MLPAGTWIPSSTVPTQAERREATCSGCELRDVATPPAEVLGDWAFQEDEGDSRRQPSTAEKKE